MDIQGFSDATIEKFVDRGFIKQFADFFTLPWYKDEIIQMEGFGEKSYQKLVNAANEARHTSFVPLIIGKGQAKLLNKEFSGNVMMFFRAAYNRKSFCSIDGIGEVLEDNIWKWANEYLGWIPFKDPSTDRSKIHGVNWEIVELIKQLDFVQENASAGNALSGMTFVITGSLNHYDNRDALVSVIEQNGGKVSGSVSAKTTYLINNDVESTSVKNKKAKEIGVKIISEEDFMNLLV